MSHTIQRMSHVPHRNESCHTWKCVMIQVAHNRNENWMVPNASGWVMPRIRMSHEHTHRKQSYHIWEWFRRHASEMQVEWANMKASESCNAYGWVTSHIGTSNVTNGTASSVRRCASEIEWAHMNGVCHACGWVTYVKWRIQYSFRHWCNIFFESGIRVARRDTPCHTKECVMIQALRIRIKVRMGAYQWVVQHIWMSHVPYRNESCHKWECVMIQAARTRNRMSSYDVSCHTDGWVTSRAHAGMSHVTQLWRNTLRVLCTRYEYTVVEGIRFEFCVRVTRLVTQLWSSWHNFEVRDTTLKECVKSRVKRPQKQICSF